MTNKTGEKLLELAYRSYHILNKVKTELEKMNPEVRKEIESKYLNSVVKQLDEIIPIAAKELQK